jgi:hypothetical protein
MIGFNRLKAYIQPPHAMNYGASSGIIELLSGLVASLRFDRTTLINSAPQHHDRICRTAVKKKMLGNEQLLGRRQFFYQALIGFSGLDTSALLSIRPMVKANG